MDKNMVNIDDLFRQRLQGGEEKERPGAWGNMRALLDKEMPAEVAPTFNFRRMAGYIVGGLMLAALSVGGYKSYERTHADRNLLGDNNEKAVVASNAHAFSNAKSATSAIADAGRNAVAVKNPAIAPVKNNGSATHTSSSDHSGTHTTTAHNNTHGTGTAQHTATGHNNNSTGVHTDGTAATGNRHHQGGQHVASVTTASANGAQNADGQNTANNPVSNSMAIAADNKNAAQSATQQPASATTTASSVQHSGNHTAGNNNHQNGAGNHHTVNGLADLTPNASGNITTPLHPAASGHNSGQPGDHGNINPITPASATGSGNNTPAPYTLIKDTIEKIRLLQHYVRDNMSHVNVLRVDTVAIEHEIVDRLILKHNEEQQTAGNTQEQKNTTQKRNTTAQKRSGGESLAQNTGKNNSGSTESAVDPASAPPPPNSASAADSKDLVPLDNYKVASKKSYLWDPEHFREMVMRAKFNLGQVKFFPGLVAGINATMFGPNSMAGFQLGLSGVFALNDRWSVVTELKYITRFNNGMSLKDNYVGQPTDSFATYNTAGTRLENMNYNRDSMEHYFNFSTLGSVELPISVRYAINRLYVMGGINLVYNFSINAEEISRAHEIITTLPYNHGPLNWPEGKPTVTLTDFNSRFGLGYLLGLGYQITPAVNLDLRMTQTFWDNAKGAGAQKVSTDLFKSPSMQLSIGYRFRQNRH